ncbi:sigma-70 family RNA polymerase sigma factor [Armatimonas rosea]|uniref:RNA polymerase sigma-70 factor (ECF subfamily) n=1 Tax=Armatimonas rosea TaxID=685828 RepID=A0A7W9SV14_ARMRO|nr:sigma-70 family RNA polymerase sigma factor [Armatimonas rosea]MBB6052870.1 RNA polymerase sigma-70 factor (ECF subfamily) [Armatimonas rosea]
MWRTRSSTTTQRHAEFDALVAKDWERFWRFAYRLTSDRDLAEDLLSETLIDAFSAFDRYRGEKFASWFFRMLTTNRIDMARKARRRQAESLDTVFSETEGKDIADNRENPELRLLNPLYSEPVQKALDALPLENRVAILLADVEGYDYVEIAQMLHIPIGTVRSRIFRGREKLRLALSQSTTPCAEERHEN